MTMFENASLVISGLGSIVVALSLLYVARQTRIIRRQTEHVAQSVRISMHGSIADQMLRIDSLFIEYPELRPYFYEGKELPPAQELSYRASAVAETLLDFFDSLALMMEQVVDVWPWEWWEEYIVDSFASSPILCKTLSDRSHWYRPELSALMRRGKERKNAAAAKAAQA